MPAALIGVAVLASQLTLAGRLDAVLAAPELRGAVASVCVVSAEGSTLYEKGADTRVMPASNEKILTAVFALDTLGPNWQPKTQFWKSEDGICIDAPGDPTLTTAQLETVRAQLNPTPGKLVSIRQAFQPGYPPAWEYDDLPFTYAAPIHALSCDDACFTLSSKGGAFAAIPEYLHIKIQWNQNAKKLSSKFDPWQSVLSLQGPAPKDDREIEKFPNPDPSGSIAGLLGGHKVDVTQVPTRAADAQIVGPKLSDILAACLKPSDNNYAEHIFLMAASSQGELGPDPYQTAEQRLTDFLEKKVMVEAGMCRPIDGSGLSRHNLVTARALAQVLRFGLSHDYGPALCGALAKPGEGTLKNRLKGIDLVGKTGTVNSVSSLSGILHPGSKTPVIFAIVFNHYTKPASQMRAIQDKFIAELALDDSHGLSGSAGGPVYSRLSDKRDGTALGHRNR